MVCKRPAGPVQGAHDSFEGLSQELCGSIDGEALDEGFSTAGDIQAAQAVPGVAASSEAVPGVAASSQAGPGVAASPQAVPGVEAPAERAEISEAELQQLKDNPKPDAALIKRIYNRLSATALAKDTEAKKLYKELNALPYGRGKNSKKFLFAWSWYEKKEETGKDFPPEWWEEIQQLQLSEKHSFEGLWLTAGRLATLVGTEEAREMIEGKELKEKTVNGRKRYFYVEEHQSREAKKVRAWKTSGKQQLTDGEAAKASFDGLQTQAVGFEEEFPMALPPAPPPAVTDGKRAAVEDSVDDDDAGDEASSQVPSKRSRRSLVEKPAGVMVSRAARQGHTVLQKLMLAVKTTQLKINESKYCDMQAKELQSFLRTVLKAAHYLECQVVNVTTDMENMNKKIEEVATYQAQYKKLMDTIPKACLA